MINADICTRKQIKTFGIMKAKQNWKSVTISGVTGILMGAGTSYATRELTFGDEKVAELDERIKEMVAEDGQSFKEAFDAARAELGPGAVFRWRGNLFNTYTEDEWNSMSDEDKEQFTKNLNPEVSPSDIDTAQIEDVEEEVEVQMEEEDADVALASVEDDEETVNEEEINSQNVTAQEESQQDAEDTDVRVIGYGDVDLANGRSVTVEELDINGQRVAIIDVDQDGVGDIAMSDLNGNNQADEGEIVDLHTGDAISFENQTSMDDTDSDSFVNIMPA